LYTVTAGVSDPRLVTQAVVIHQSLGIGHASDPALFKLETYCKLSTRLKMFYCIAIFLWLLTFQFKRFMIAFWAILTFWGTDPALIAHGSLDLKQEIKKSYFICHRFVSIWAQA
jgi:hypothetical protein